MSRVILHIADFAAPYPGAFITQLRMLDSEVRGRGIGQCAFIFPPTASNSAWYGQWTSEGTSVSTLPPGTFGSSWRTATALARAVERADAALVHSHFGSYDVAAAVAVARLRRRGQVCGLLWHYRTALEEDVDARSISRRIKDFIRYRLSGQPVDGCLAVTAALAVEAARRGLGDKAMSMLAGCDVESFRPDADVRGRVRAALGLADSDVLVLHLGWAWHRKGGDLLAGAAQLLEERGHTDLVYFSVGAPQDVPRIRSLPFTDRIADIHRAADVFVSASRSEGFGNGVVEAMASGTPVVAALAAGQRETFEGVPGCVTVPLADCKGLANGMETMLSARSDWARLGAANRAHVESNYDMRDWARRMADVYERHFDCSGVRP